MKKYVLSLAVVSALLLVTTDVQAQSWKDLFNKDNIEKVVNAVTGNQTIDMTGTWTYSGSAIEFESDNLLQKAGQIDFRLVGAGEHAIRDDGIQQQSHFHSVGERVDAANHAHAGVITKKNLFSSHGLILQLINQYRRKIIPTRP